MLLSDDVADNCEDELAQRFADALASLPPAIPPDPLVLHQRLRRRRIRTGMAGLAGLIVMVSLVVTVGVAGSSDPTSATMTLFARDDPAVSQGELSADAKIIRDRLHALGDAGVSVSVSDDTVVVAGGTVELVDPSVVLAESPALRQMGNSVLSLMLHPAAILLPVARGDGQRDLVGPTQVSLSPHEAALLDEVAVTYGPGELAVDLDGEIMSILIRDTAQSGYEPFEDRLELVEPSQARADQIAAALQAGPLPLPLELASAV